MSLLAYLDRWSVRPGDRVELMVSCAAPEVTAEVVRLTGGGPRPASDAFTHESVDVELGTFPGGCQDLLGGSYVEVHDLPPAASELTLSAWIFPTTVSLGRHQGLISRREPGGGRGFSLGIDGKGHLELTWCAQEDRHVVALEAPLLQGEWAFVAASVDAAASSVRLHQWSAADWLGGPRVQEGEWTPGGLNAFASNAPLRLGCGGLRTGAHQPHRLGCHEPYNGKLDGPAVALCASSLEELAALRERPMKGSAVSARWDFSREMHGRLVVDVSTNGHHGHTFHSPTRAVTGHNWTGEALDVRVAADEYGAIHFHEDDLDDAGWEPTCSFTVPVAARSGVYAVRVATDEATRYLAFFVAPPVGSSSARVAFVAPTFTYTAYSNFVPGLDQVEIMTGQAADLEPDDDWVRRHPEVGLSMYNRHSDGSGICHVSQLRPMLDMDPRHRFWLSNGGGWAVSGDMYLVDWLEHEGIPYDVLTDEHIHAEGSVALEDYAAVITGAHPEYCSSAMLDGYRNYLAGGGRLMYLGGNGFYWVTTPVPERPCSIEVRRGHSATRSWASRPGETHHSSTGEPGGLWRERGRAPQRLVGVGFAAEGGGGSAPYRRLPADLEGRAAFIFEGVTEGDVFGAYGNNMGGAAGDEIDRADRELGTPEHALILATSSGLHSDLYQHVIEENLLMRPGRGGTTCERVRADIVFFETAEGAAVFSVGSIDWSASLSHNGYSNDVARITRNVLDAFMKGEWHRAKR